MWPDFIVFSSSFHLRTFSEARKSLYFMGNAPAKENNKHKTKTTKTCKSVGMEVKRNLRNLRNRLCLYSKIEFGNKL